MRRVLLVLWLLGFVACASAQKVEVYGTVTDVGNKPLADVIVKIVEAQKTYAFTTTDAKGAYSLTLDAKTMKGKSLSLTFTHISFEKQTIVLSQVKDKIRHNVVLQAKNTVLKEVTVRAQPLHMAGDTLKYNLASFVGKGDVTLEDGLKRLPGLEVSKVGAISYNGKGISKFYIEGMDMLGGKYNLATQNIPAHYATQVEVLRHHKEKKVDTDTESDEVAINVKLSRKAKFKPFGQPEVGVGYRGDDPLVALGLTGMMFTDNYQLLGSAKFSNNGDYGKYDIIDHAYSMTGESTAPLLLPRWSGGAPPLGDYLDQRTGYGSLNSITKKGEDCTFRLNAEYAYERNQNTFTNQTLYFADGQNIDIQEEQHPYAHSHKPSLTMRYVRNADKIYFNEEFIARASFENADNPVVYNQTNFGQHRDATSLYVRNMFNTTVKKGNTKYNISSHIDFQRTPEVKLLMNDILQTAQSTSLKTVHSTSLTFYHGRWRIGMPLQLNADYDFLETVLSGTAAMDNRQRLKGWSLTPTASPSTEWDSSNKKMHASLYLRVKWDSFHYSSLCGKVADTHYSKILFEPDVHFRYTFSGTSEMTANSSIRHTTGDMLDLLTQPVQTDYRNSFMASGIIGETQVWRTSVSYKYQLPFSYFSMNISAGWNQGKQNVLSSQVVSGEGIHIENLAQDSHNRSASASITLSKNYIPIHTKLEGSFSGNWGSRESMTQHTPVTVYSKGYTVSGKAIYSPVTWSEITAHISYGESYTRFKGVNNAYDDLDITGSLAVYPVKPLEIKFSYDYVHAQISASQHKDASLLHASAQFKAKRATWKLSLRNLLDTKHYTYTTYSGPDRYIFDCSLLGRTIMLTYTFNLTKSNN